MFLIYAEAANEAWGPDLDPKGYGFTPRSILAAVRKRAGIPIADPYLASITTQADMRELIRNERRIELCFEGQRFWICAAGVYRSMKRSKECLLPEAFIL